MTRLSLSFAIVSALAAGAASAQVPTYGELELQARTNLLVNDNGWNLPPGSSFNSVTPAINDEGFVTFPVQVVTDPSNPSIAGAGIWHGRHGEGGIVFRHDAPGNEIYIGDKAAINVAGEVAYVTHGGGTDYRLWLYDPAAGDPVQVSVLPLTPSSFSNLALSDDRYIGYQGMFGTGRGYASTLALAPPPERDSVAHVYDANVDPASPFNYLYSPAMNNARVIAGKVNVGVGSDYSREEIRLFAADGTSAVVVSDTDIDPASPFDRFDNSLAVNDAGDVAVSVRLAEGGVRAVYRFDAGGEAVEIARVGAPGPILEIDSFAPSINNDGLVAFRARDVDGQAVYVGDGETLVRVFGRGDLIEIDLGLGQIGQHDSSPVFGGAPAINDHGDVVAIAGLHPEGNNQVEWGSGVIVAWAKAGEDDTIFASGFE
jgi:hypothetical protein